MIPLLLSVWTASLIGGLHCAGMCGGFVCAVSVPGRATLSQAAWHLGRGLAYVAIGFAAGSLGRGLESALATTGLQHAAAIAAAALLVVRGVSMLASGAARPARPAPWSRLVASAIRGVRALPVVPRAALVGALAALLPCGWLWAFVATAAGTGQPVGGALVMLTFWSGTIPALAGVGLAAGGLLARFRDRIPRVTAIAMIVVGLLTVVGRFRPHDHAATHGTGHAGHAGPAAHETRAAASPAAHAPGEHAHAGR